jgi:intracellular septation protein A
MPELQPPAAPDVELLRGRSLWLGFTGLIPLMLMVPILLLHLYAAGIIEGLLAGSVVIAYHLARQQGVTSIDLLTVAFAALNGALYFGFDNRTIIANLDVAIYTLLAAIIVLSLIRQQPWTTQFAKRMVPPEMWDRPAFQTINMRITAIWAAAFVTCDLVVLLASGSIRRYVPIALLTLTAALVPRLARWYRTRLT